MTFLHHAQTSFMLLLLQVERGQKEGRGPATLVLRPSEGLPPKRDRTAPIEARSAAIGGVKVPRFQDAQSANAVKFFYLRWEFLSKSAFGQCLKEGQP
jgi:hypothetical protein